MPRRRHVVVGMASLLAAPAVHAQAWPQKPLRWIVPFVPGGGTDTVSRLVADPLQRILGQQVLVENKGGAGGNIGTTELARAAPDGYTVGLISVASHTLNPMLYSRLPYDPDRDIAPISLLATLANLLGATPSLPVTDVASLIQLAKKEPGKYAYASSGPGTSLHLSGEMFKVMAGVDLLHVPYRGAGAAYNDLASGQVHLMFGNLPGMLPQVRSGKLRGLAVTGPTRSRAAPELPTVGETVPGFVATSWYGMGAPAGVPEPILARLEAAVTEVLANKDLQERFVNELGLDVVTPGRKAIAEHIAADRKLWGPSVKAAGVKLD